MDKNVIWIDNNDNILGEVSLIKAHQEGLLHRISVVYLANDTNQVLIQKRNDGRLDHSAAGHVDVGESYLEAAKRELEEELGVSGIDLQEIGDCSSNESGNKIRHRFKVFVCKTNPGKLDPSEVEEVFWANPVEIWGDMKNDNDDKKYCGGFKVTLELYLRNLSVQL
ncbi:MAG: NUDIX domain-containing protein [Candidatus Paceibacterota bacterium]